MSILQNELPNAKVLDLFAGSGALGLEALSRGAASVDFVEIARPSLTTLRDNIVRLEADRYARVHVADALQFIQRLERDRYDIAFVDPPYRLGLCEPVVARWIATPFATILSVEHSANESLPEGGETRRYGDTLLTFYNASRALSTDQ